MQTRLRLLAKHDWILLTKVWHAFGKKGYMCNLGNARGRSWTSKHFVYLSLILLVNGIISHAYVDCKNESNHNFPDALYPV